MARKQLLENLGRVLIRRRDAIRRAFEGQRRLVGDRDRVVGDLADAAVDSEQEELDSQLASAESRELRAINEALDRIMAGTFGICSECGKNIPTARLNALPYAEMCIECQREVERQGAPSLPFKASGLGWDETCLAG